MKRNNLKSLWIAGMLGLVLLLAACSPAGGVLPGTGDEDVPAAVESARLWLSQQLGTPLEEIAVNRAEAAEWPDSCLGLGRPNESCALAVTSGWLGVFEVDGTTYEVHIDETGTNFRVAEWATTPMAPEGTEEVAPNETPEATPEGTPGAVPGAADLAGTRWELVSFGAPGSETAAVGESPVILEFLESGKAGGEAGCNSYGMAYEVQDGRLVFDEVVSTLMACEDQALMDQEQQYLAALGAAGEYELQGDQLTIPYDDGQGVLNFVRLEGEGE